MTVTWIPHAEWWLVTPDFPQESLDDNDATSLALGLEQYRNRFIFQLIRSGVCLAMVRASLNMVARSSSILLPSHFLSLKGTDIATAIRQNDYR